MAGNEQVHGGGSKVGATFSIGLENEAIAKDNDLQIAHDDKILLA